MNPKKLVHSVALLTLLAFLLIFSSAALAQTEPAEGTGLEKSPASEEFDRKALKKLQSMSPEEVDELDKKLAEALTLFYDREYVRALTIFQEISGTVETMDVAFWMGSCAAKAGETDLAITKFRNMLEVDPNLHRVRLELATVYFGLGRYADARKELNTVLEAKPPEPVRQNIEKLLASIDAKTRKLYPNLRFSFGIQKDSNVSSAPDVRFVDVPGGGFLTLNDNQKAAQDKVAVLNMSGNLLYDFGDRRGFMWNTTGAFYNTHNFDFIMFDFLHWRVTSGPWWVTQKSVFKMPIGYAQNTYEHEHLFDTFDITPSFEYFLTPKVSLKGTFSYARDTYEPTQDDNDKTGQDNNKRLYEFATNLYLNQRRDIFSFSVAEEDSNAKQERFGYEAIHWSASWFKRFVWFKNWDMEFYARYKYTLKHYLAAALLWPVGEHRKDTRHNLYTVLSRNYGKHYFTSVSFNYIDNDSSVDLYDFDKMIYNFSVGFKF